DQREAVAVRERAADRAAVHLVVLDPPRVLVADRLQSFHHRGHRPAGHGLDAHRVRAVERVERLQVAPAAAQLDQLAADLIRVATHGNLPVVAPGSLDVVRDGPVTSVRQPHGCQARSFQSNRGRDDPGPPGGAKKARRAARSGRLRAESPPRSRGWQEDARALPCRRRGERRVLSVCAPLLLAAAAGREAPASPPPALTETRQVRGLSAEEAARRRPVHLRATVTYHHRFPGWNPLFVQDAGGGIYVELADGLDLPPGGGGEIDGARGPGRFQPGGS